MGMSSGGVGAVDTGDPRSRQSSPAGGATMSVFGVRRCMARPVTKSRLLCWLLVASCVLLVLQFASGLVMSGWRRHRVGAAASSRAALVSLFRFAVPSTVDSRAEVDVLSAAVGTRHNGSRSHAAAVVDLDPLVRSVMGVTTELPLINATRAANRSVPGLPERVIDALQLAGVPLERIDHIQTPMTTNRSVQLRVSAGDVSMPSASIPPANARPLCSLVPLKLVGRLSVSKTAESWEKIKSRSESRLLQPGGLYKPSDCTARHRVAIIVPFRDRDEHLRVFLSHLHPILQRQQLEYGILVVEQAGSGTFNRASLMNVGAVEALKLHDYQCFVFHDVDLLPEDDRNLYTCPEQPRHLSVAVDTFKYTLPYNDLFGGASAMSREHFALVNGFSNQFWGWGGEDDDMASRLSFHKLFISRYPVDVARYTMLTHHHSSANPKRYQLLRKSAKRLGTDGLVSLEYSLQKLVMKPMYTWLLVELKEP